MSEIRALLLTDIVNSTRLAERIGDAAMGALWTAHDRVARDLLREWRGREIDKTDGMLALFDRVADAAGYALAYHRALASLPTSLKARAGLHVGPVTLRENERADVERGAKALQVEGLAIPVAARVMAVALAGQTLLTADARQALGSTALRVESRGFWRAKGLAEPFELFEIGNADSPFLPPLDVATKAYRVTRHGEQWLPVTEIKRSLPAERDVFVGRGDALHELAHRFERGARLVSLLGMGGTGKTRLATRFAWTWLGDFPGGAWFCDLSAARTLDGIVHAVAQALDVPLGRQDPVAQLGNAIAGRGRCLVVLDNFEQVARHAEETLGQWLNRAAEARFIVTSREVLGLAGEEAFALAPLPPADAAALFERRAESAKRDFAPSDEDRAAIAPLVKLLDGLPLAIELAAARVRVMSPRTLLARASERFKLLASTGGRRDRQATLRAAFDWSWSLLGDAEKAALAQLSVFEGGFTLRAAEAVLEHAGDDARASWSVDSIQSLVDKSFVRQSGDYRFDLLGTVQEYAADHLSTPDRYPGSGPEARTTAQQRHGAYLASLSEQDAIADRGAEIDNLFAACRRAVARADAAIAVGTLENAWAALKLRGPFRAGADLAALVCSMRGLDPGQLARAERVAGIALDVSGQPVEARSHMESALSLARAASDRHAEARVLGDLGNLCRNEGRIDEGLAHTRAALALACELGARTFECDLRDALGSSRYETGDLDQARVEYEAALALARDLGDRRRESGTLGNLANLQVNLGRMDEARSNYEAGLAAAREIGHRQWEANMQCNLGFLHLTQQRMDEARSHFEAALVAAREMGYARLECIALGNLGIVLDSLGQRLEAAERYEAALVVARQIGQRRYEGQFLNYLGLLRARTGRLEDARRCLDNSETLLREVSDRISLGVLLCSRAETEALAGAPGAARAALDEARTIASEAGAGPESELGQALARVENLIEAKT